MLKVKRLKVVYSCLWGTRHRAMERHLPYGITHLAQVYMPLFNPSQTDRYSISYLGGIECWVDPAADCIPRWFICPHTVTRPSSGPARNQTRNLFIANLTSNRYTTTGPLVTSECCNLFCASRSRQCSASSRRVMTASRSMRWSYRRQTRRKGNTTKLSCLRYFRFAGQLSICCHYSFLQDVSIACYADALP